MNPSANNTILITGGGSGIGRGLAEAFHKLGNKVIIAGRRKDVLESVVAANPGMDFSVLDVQDSAKLSNFVTDITSKYPALNVLINMAGIMKFEDLVDSPDTAVISDTIATNITAPMLLTAALLPLLKRQTTSTIMTVTSGPCFPRRSPGRQLTAPLRPLFTPGPFRYGYQPPQHLSGGPGACTTLCPDRAWRRAPGQRSPRHAARRLHRPR